MSAGFQVTGPATRHCANVSLLLVHRLRRWANIKQTLAQHLCWIELIEVTGPLCGNGSVMFCDHREISEHGDGPCAGWNACEPKLEERLQG